MSFRIHFQDTPHSDSLRDQCEQWVSDLREEFPETSKFEVTLRQTGASQSAHVVVTGKDLKLAASAEAHDLRDSLVDAFEKVKRQLRKHHDRQIFSRRRDAHRTTQPGARSKR